MKSGWAARDFHRWVGSRPVICLVQGRETRPKRRMRHVEAGHAALAWKKDNGRLPVLS